MKHLWLRIDCHEPQGQIFITPLRRLPGSPDFKLAFEAIPVEKIGVRE